MRVSRAVLMLALIAGCDQECTDEPARVLDPELPWGLGSFSYFVFSNGRDDFGTVSTGLYEPSDEDPSSGAFGSVQAEAGLGPRPSDFYRWYLNVRTPAESMQRNGRITMSIGPAEDYLTSAPGSAVVAIDSYGKLSYAPGGTVTLDVDFCDGWIEGHVDSYDKRFDATFVGPLEVENENGAFDWCDE